MLIDAVHGTQVQRRSNAVDTSLVNVHAVHIGVSMLVALGAALLGLFFVGEALDAGLQGRIGHCVPLVIL